MKKTPIDLRNTLKSDLNEDKNESGKFGESESNFKELLKKLIEDKNTKQKTTNIIKKDKNTKKGKEIINNITITKKNNKIEKVEEIKENNNENDNNLFKNNLNFTLNGENIKSEKVEGDNNNRNKIIFGMKKEKKNKEEKKEEKKIESSSQKKKIDALHNSNLNKEISLNSISTIDNNIDSMKITGSYYHSINKLISDIGSRRGRRKSNITNSYFKNKGIFNINDMISYSSSQSNNLFNNYLDICQRRNSNFQISRYNSTQNINSSKDNLNYFMFLKNFKTLNIEKNNKNEKSNNGSSQNSGQDSLSLINKLKNLNLSLENERSYSNILKNINNTKKMNNNNKNVFTFSKTPDISRNHSRNMINKRNYKSKISSHSMNTESTKSTTSNFYYPDVYYISGENNLHKKTHVSTFFSKLKNGNNNKYM